MRLLPLAEDVTRTMAKSVSAMKPAAAAAGKILLLLRVSVVSTRRTVTLCGNVRLVLVWLLICGPQSHALSGTLKSFAALTPLL